MRYYRSSALGASDTYQWREKNGKPVCWSPLTNTVVSDNYCGDKPSAFKTGLSVGVNWLRSDLQTQGALRAGPVAPTSGTPSWLLPVGLGLAVVGVVLIAKKKK